MFTVGDEEHEEIYHLSRRTFRLNGRTHELILLRQLTAELRRQEVQTWKKVIRVISHELNNSLAPIASLAHSGAELVRRGQYERLPNALATIEDRARHLEGFIRDYARFAKLPAPRVEAGGLEALRRATAHRRWSSSTTVRRNPASVASMPRSCRRPAQPAEERARIRIAARRRARLRSSVCRTPGASKSSIAAAA